MTVDIETPTGQLMDAFRASVEKYGSVGFTEDRLLRWTSARAGLTASPAETEEEK